ncbi:hypothetical protein Kpol_529p13 [Vanderwaltozyma polyspora DSM 70294]|uniref:C2H2-type domain-containing protein n=1 Tax=Vanderwaltozyma polyspora (strain ATCC 22028 / DSM 70294 / BCRC 21397 / CBS 2163 / NBRC 10782 / NRRL Y-8283 / UCD 57-17) TaxID=436907 RepID=A7TM66_VANPO|nr:uncharacterized protein Kpol_529p13 [Vanderwaltozyma polyspora DSM 70294]EDO16633.1 hypothetical protein Kpol_529p13 [Vanderwaltozyma polyspora DSM 70294]
MTAVERNNNILDYTNNEDNNSNDNNIGNTNIDKNVVFKKRRCTVTDTNNDSDDINNNIDINGSTSVMSRNNSENSINTTNALKSNSNNMNSKVNKNLSQLPENLRLNGVTPSGKPRLFVCSICTRAFARQEHLTRHERSHTKEKPYCCGICQRKFSRRDLLLRHAHKIHGGNYGDSITITSNGTVSTEKNTPNSLISSPVSSNLVSITDPALDVGTIDENNNKFIFNNKSSTSSKEQNNNANNNNKRKLTNSSKGRRKFTRNVLSLKNTKTNIDKKKISSKTNNTQSIKRLNKRRASFSAQSAEKYALPIITEDNNHIYDRIKFSTPELLPLDYFNNPDTNTYYKPNLTNNEEIPNLNINNFTCNNNNSQLTFPINDFNLNDTIEWINGSSNINNINNINNNINSTSYSNNDNLESSASPQSQQNFNNFNVVSGINDLAVINDYATNNIDDNNNDFQLLSKYASSSAIDEDMGDDFEDEGNMTRSSTAFTINNSYNTNTENITNKHEEDDSVISGSKPNYSQKTNGYQLPSTASLFGNYSYQKSNKPKVTDQEKVDTNSINTPVSISNKLSNVNLNDDVFDVNHLSTFTNDIQNIFGKYIQDEEKQFYSNDNKKDKNIPMNNNIAPQLNCPNDNYTFYGLDHFTISNITRATPPESNDTVNYSNLKPVKLFTPELRQLCITALNYYKECSNSNGNMTNCYNYKAHRDIKSAGMNPLLVAKDLVLPSCNELNNYLSYFQQFFLPHHSFIHPNVLHFDLSLLRRYVHEELVDLNELKNDFDDQGEFDNEIYDREDFNLRYANIACLPLFMATCGSFYKPGSNPKTMELYEISRRVLHVYLETRKKLSKKEELSNYPHSKKFRNLWLIQTLILSIVFAIFADSLKSVDENTIKRQISAVCSIVKKNIIPTISFPDSKYISFTDKKEIFRFNNKFQYIIFESSLRSTLMVYNFCRFLNVFYNIDSNLFLSGNDIENIVIPDDEANWILTSLFDTEREFDIRKQNSVTYQKYYHSFAFNKLGMHPLSEILITTMLYYEFNSSNFSTFHVFLNKIDTKKLELNFPQHFHNIINDSDEETYDKIENHSKILCGDSITLRNTLMSIYLFNKIDVRFCSKIWNDQINDVFHIFLNSENLNIFTKGSYSLLTDFLVALNFSIKNISNLFVLKDDAKTIELDATKITVFNIQSYYYNFLIIIKYILDFEATPNFKLLCIYTELKKLANKLLIPKFYMNYPSEFCGFEDIVKTYRFLNVHDELKINQQYATIDVDKLEKLLNNVLVYSFNDTSFLNMSEQSTNEFLFSSNYPTYYPFTSSPPTILQSIQDEDDNSMNDMTSNDPVPTKSSMDLVATHQQILNGTVSTKTNKQGFAERYHLAAKYVTIAKCFFRFIRENHIHCHFLEKMTTDYDIIGKMLAEK